MFTDAFIANWVARFGLPSTVTTDRGTQFTSAMWTSTCMWLSIKHVLTIAYHIQSNGMVQCMHQKIKDALCAHCEGPAMPWVLLGLRAAPKQDSAVSSAELVMGSPLILPGQLLHMPDPPRFDVTPPPMRPASYEVAADSSPAHLARAQPVYMRVGSQQKPLAAPYASPYQVTAKGAKMFTILVGQPKAGNHLCGLPMAHTGRGPVSPAEATSRGCPAKKSVSLTILPATS
jgi:hypothetical protein